MMTELTLATAFMLGFLGSSHCLGMCGGISAALGLSGQQQAVSTNIIRLLAYNGGRITTYALIGAIAGYLGSKIAVVPAVSLTLRGIAGLLLIAMGLYVAGWWFGLTKIEAVGAKLWQRVQPLSRHLLPVTSSFKALKLGLLWGLLPCGLVYSTLGWALAAADWRLSALLMAAFGLGTLPAMFATGLASQRVLALLRQRGARMVAGLLIIIMGIITLWIPVSHLSHASHSNMNHGSMNHETMDHSQMDHGSMNHETMDHNHGSMNHEAMDHSQMDHDSMNHETMDHSQMDHGSMNHEAIDHGQTNHSSSDSSGAD
jgi:hypothetical protein